MLRGRAKNALSTCNMGHRINMVFERTGAASSRDGAGPLDASRWTIIEGVEHVA